jgi:hypothetical protein
MPRAVLALIATYVTGKMKYRVFAVAGYFVTMATSKF